MIVYLVRHGKAEKAGGGPDAARRLTPDGRRELEAHLRALAPGLEVSRILASPYARALESAEILASATGAPVEEAPWLASGASDGSAVLELGRAAAAGAALVGHNPEMADAVALAAGRGVDVPAGAVAALDLGPGGPRLLWLRAP